MVAKYSRLKFWIISIILLFPFYFLIFVKDTIKARDEDPFFVTVLMFLIILIWINTLANRIRDFGANPWLSLLGIIPFVNFAIAFYFGIVQYKKVK